MHIYLEVMSATMFLVWIKTFLRHSYIKTKLLMNTFFLIIPLKKILIVRLVSCSCTLERTIICSTIWIVSQFIFKVLLLECWRIVLLVQSRTQNCIVHWKPTDIYSEINPSEFNEIPKYSTCIHDCHYYEWFHQQWWFGNFYTITQS